MGMGVILIGDKNFTLERIKSMNFGSKVKIEDYVEKNLMKYSDRTLMKDIIGSADFPRDVVIDCDGVNLGLEQFGSLKIHPTAI